MNSEPHAELQGMTCAAVVRAFIAESPVLCSPGNAGMRFELKRLRIDEVRIEEL
jgi:hypothetical protein